VPLTGLTGVAQSRPNCSELSRINSISIQSFLPRVLHTLVNTFCDSGQQLWYGKKRVLRKEEKRCSLAEELSLVTLGKGAAPSMSAAKG
jgi:hypothetical protein